MRKVLLIAALAILLGLAGVIFIVFSDLGSSKEPVVVNGIRLRRYMAHTGSAGTDAALLRIGTNSIPWLIKGLEESDSPLEKLKRRTWKTLPKAWQQKWRRREPIDPFVLRRNCVRALETFGRHGAPAVPALIQLHKSDTNVHVRSITLHTIGHLGPHSPEARAFLTALLRNGDESEKKRVVSMFMAVGFTPPEAVPLLIARIENYVPSNPAISGPLDEMSALNLCGPEAASAAPALLPYIKEGAPGNALFALRATGPAAVVALPRLLEILEDKSEWATRLRPNIYAILVRLGTNGTAALPTLTNGLADPNPIVRLLAASGIAKITGDADFAVPRLIAELENRQRLGEFLTVQVSAHLIGLSHRELAAILLGELGTNATVALPSLNQAVNSPERWMHIPAGEAIWKISKDTNAVLTPIVARLKSTADVTRMQALNALGQMGPAAKPAVPAIQEAMELSVQTRRHGYEALELINGTEK